MNIMAIIVTSVSSIMLGMSIANLYWANKVYKASRKDGTNDNNSKL
jgi:hypothetical protein